MAGRGGYQPPQRPAPASGPGPLSQRTDGGPADKRQPIRELPNAEYGEAKEYRTAQQAAPMAASTGGAQGAASPPVNPAAGVVGLGANSQQPDQPVTAGADLGLGPDSAALGLPDPNTVDVKALQRVLPALELIASLPTSTQATRNVVRRLRSLS